VLELAIAKELYERYPEASEGRLAKIRSHVVSRQSCAAVARELQLGERLGEAAGEQLAGDELSRIVRSRNVTAALL
jgi:ribonuclease III